MIKLIVSIFILQLSMAGRNYNPLQWVSKSQFSIFVLDCNDSAELLDYVELFKVESSYRYDLKEKDEQALFNELFTRVQNLSDPRARQIKEWKRFLDEEVKFVKGINFGPLKDVFDFTVWDGCEIKTLAKVLPPYPDGKSIFIDQNLWDKLDSRSRVGFYFNYLINLDHIFVNRKENTSYSRFFNAYLASNRYIDASNLNEKVELYKRLKFPFLYHKGFFYKSWDGDYDIDLEANERGEFIKGDLLPVPMSYEHLGYKSHLTFKNIPGFTIKFWRGLHLSRRDDNIRYFRDTFVVSGCLGKYKIPHDEVNITTRYVNGEYILEDLTSVFLRYKGVNIKGFKIVDGTPEIIYFKEGESPGWPIKDITDC